MRGTYPTAALATLAAALLLLPAPAMADPPHLRADLTGLEEVPPQSTAAAGSFAGRIARDEQSIEFELTYTGMPSNVTQAHIHFGPKAVNGGIMVFLCSNLANPPAGTAACPTTAGTVTGVLTPGSVVGPSAQGITAGEFAEVVAAIRSGTSYVNVHTVNNPGGEIRGQVR